MEKKKGLRRKKIEKIRTAKQNIKEEKVRSKGERDRQVKHYKIQTVNWIKDDRNY